MSCSRCLCSGGTLTAEDLAAFRAVVTDAWSVPLGEFQLYFPPPPAGGATVAFIMNILKGEESGFLQAVATEMCDAPELFCQDLS